MHLSAVLAFAGIACASAPPSAGILNSPRALFGLDERQTVYCKPIYQPYTCERSCGEGYIECIDWPTCYNPGKGQTCCSDGSYCAEGYYCVDSGCCPNGSSLEDCGATKTLSVIPPPVSSATSVSEPVTASTVEESSAIVTSVLETTVRSVAPVLNMSTSAAPVTEISATTTVILETPTVQTTATAVETVPASLGANSKVEYVLMAVFGAIGIFLGGL